MCTKCRSITSSIYSSTPFTQLFNKFPYMPANPEYILAPFADYPTKPQSVYQTKDLLRLIISLREVFLKESTNKWFTQRECCLPELMIEPTAMHVFNQINRIRINEYESE